MFLSSAVARLIDTSLLNWNLKSIPQNHLSTWLSQFVVLIFSLRFYYFIYFFIAGIYFPSNAYFSVETLNNYWGILSRFPPLSCLLGPIKASQPLSVLIQKSQESGCAHLLAYRLEWFVETRFRVTIIKFVVTFVWLKYH